MFVMYVLFVQTTCYVPRTQEYKLAIFRIECSNVCMHMHIYTVECIDTMYDITYHITTFH